MRTRSGASATRRRAKIEAALRNLLIERHHEEDAVRPRARAQPRRRGRRRVPRRDREPARARGPLPPVAARALRGRARGARRSTRGRRRHRGRDRGPAPSRSARERVELDIGERHSAELDTIVDPLLVPDLATMVWAPHGHAEAVDALRRLAQIVLVDSQDEPDVAAALDARGRAAPSDAYVVDLAWLRSTPWRERVAAAFDPPALRAQLGAISAVTVRHRAGLAGGRAAVLRLAVLAPGLASPGRSSQRARRASPARARTRRQEVTLRLEPVDSSAPGLAGVTIEMASGASVSLDRGPGGLRGACAARATARSRRGRCWAPRAARAASSARASARRCCATRRIGPALSCARGDGA